jgi:hypothetical protein
VAFFGKAPSIHRCGVILLVEGFNIIPRQPRKHGAQLFNNVNIYGNYIHLCMKQVTV